MLNDKATLILHNANIITCDLVKPYGQAIAVDCTRIVLVGKNEDVKELKGQKTRVIDCQGKTVIPGFIDAHCHFFSFVNGLLNLDVGPGKCKSIKEIIVIISRKAKTTPRGEWIHGEGYNEFCLEEKRHPTRLDLDEAAPDHPVIISHRSGHGYVLNSSGLKLIGINNETEEPPGGIIDRDLATGQPNGILFEMDGYIRERIKSNLSEEVQDQAIAEANRQYLSQGITSIGEATWTNDYSIWEKFKGIKQAQKLGSRINMMVGLNSLEDFRRSNLITGSGDDHLRIGAVKIILSQATGNQNPSQGDLNQAVAEASGAGFQVAIHAVEQSSVRAALTAFEFAAASLRMRHRIEHCSECPPEMLPQLAQLRTIVVSQPAFIYYSGERYLVDVPMETQQWLYPFRSIMENGNIVAASSDSPIEPNNPLTGIFTAVTRKSESGQKVTASQAVEPQDALEMYTRNAAYASFDEKVKGSLKPGKLADMLILSQDPIKWLVTNKDKTASEFTKNVFVETTIIGGRVVWPLGQ